MEVSYNTVDFQNVRVRKLDYGPEKDPSGTDNIMTKVDLEISFQWSPYSTASIPASAKLLNGPGPFPNDSLGLSIRNLRKLLTEPRRTLKITSGGDPIWQCPVPVSNAVLSTQPSDPNTPKPSCDPNYGPLPELVSVAEVIGDKLAAGVWRVTFWVLDGSHLFLSNRWNVTCTVNDAGMTTRRIKGAAQCRADAVVSGNIGGIDDLRRWFFLPVPSGFRRTGCMVHVDETNTRATYEVTDVEDPNPLGLDGGGVGAVKFSGEITAGVISVNRTWGQRIRGAIETGLTLGAALAVQMPTTVSQGWVKVVGGKGADKLQLMKLAVGIAQDRFFSGAIVALTVTQGVGESEQGGRWVKVSVVFVPLLSQWVASAWNTIENNIADGNFVNLSNDIKPLNLDSSFFTSPTPVLRNGLPMVFPGKVAPNESNTDYKNFNLPNGRADKDPTHDTGSRGSWLGAMLTQSIQYQGELPSQPPPNRQVTEGKLT